MNDAYEKHFGQIIGCKIVDFYMEDEDDLNPWPVLVIQQPNDQGGYYHGQKYKLVLSQDEEGNGGGFAFIEEVVEAQEKLRKMRKVYEAQKKRETA